MTVLEAGLYRPPRFRRLFAALALAFGVLAVAAAALAGRAVLHREEAMPGVTVLGAQLAGLTQAEAGLEIRRVVAARLREPVTLEVGVEIAPNKLFLLDRVSSARAALAAGRDSWTGRARSLLAPLTEPLAVDPVLVVRPQAEARLAAALKELTTPPVSAGVAMEGTQPRVRPGSPGTAVDTVALLEAIEAWVLGAGGAPPVRFTTEPPPVGVPAAEAAADEARLVVSAPVDLTVDGEPVGSLPPERLASLLTFEEHGDRLLVLFDGERLAKVLEPRVAPFRTRARNAQFAVDGTRARVIPAVPGTTLDVERAVVAVTTAAHATGNRAAALTLKSIPAERTTQEAVALGIRERISTFTTEMGPSSSNRIHNVHLMADYIDGTIVEPGKTFSFNHSVGPRTAERGFLEGQMIVGSLLLPSVGGGVCQTATTLFNNAFELGLPITERHNHSFYISHYPLGRDATVSWGGPDFGFRNDMEHAVLIKTSYTDETLTFSFYGTDEGRTVTSTTSEKTNWRTPGLTYALDPAAPRGSVRTVSGDRQSGFDVTVHRTVEKNGKVLRKDSFTSHYIPVGDTHIYGPGREIPGSYFVLPTT